MFTHWVDVGRISYPVIERCCSVYSGRLQHLHSADSTTNWPREVRHEILVLEMSTNILGTWCSDYHTWVSSVSPKDCRARHYRSLPQPHTLTDSDYLPACFCGVTSTVGITSLNKVHTQIMTNEQNVWSLCLWKSSSYLIEDAKTNWLTLYWENNRLWFW